jgi:polyketide biosynthesis acyl carrier protein
MAHGKTREQVFDIVKKNILEVLPHLSPADISMDRSMPDLGANSVDRMEVVTQSMEDLGLKIPLMSFAKVANIDGLVGVLFENL